MNYIKADGYIIVDNTIISYIGNESELVIPSIIENVAVERIGAGAFLGNEQLCAVIIEDGIKSIGKKAFGQCKNLRSLTLAESVKEIEADAFFETDIYDASFYLDVEYNSYLGIKEGSIKLYKGGYLIDPNSFGEKSAKMIRNISKRCYQGGFRIIPEMGYLVMGQPFDEKDVYKNSQIENIEIFVFEDYKIKNDVAPIHIMSEKAIFSTKVKNDIDTIWIPHNEEKNDKQRNNFGWRIFDSIKNTGVLFLEEEGQIGDGYISLKLSIKTGIWFFHNPLKINVDDHILFYMEREFFSCDRRNPFVRERESREKVFDKGGDVASEKYIEAALNKYEVLRKLV